MPRDGGPRLARLYLTGKIDPPHQRRTTHKGNEVGVNLVMTPERASGAEDLITLRLPTHIVAHIVGTALVASEEFNGGSKSDLQGSSDVM